MGEQTMNDTISGGMGSLLKILAGHPIETLKVRMQVNRSCLGMFSQVRSIHQREGIRGFYKGVLPNIPAMFLYNSSLFMGYGLALDSLDNPQSYKSIAIAGAFGGIFASLVCSPLELVKIKMQVQTHSSNSQLQTLLSISKAQGILGMYKGVHLMILREIPANMLYFTCFEYILRLEGFSSNEQRIHEKAPISAVFLAGGLAGIANWILVFPLDTLKSKFQASDCRDTNWREFCKAELGKPWKHLYKGYFVCLLRAFLANSATFVGVEYTRRVLCLFQKR